MKNKTARKTVLLIGIGFAALFWIMESSVETLIFNNGSFVGQILTVDPHEIWSRLIVMGIIILFGVYAQLAVTKRGQITQALRASEDWLSSALRSIGDAVIATDAKGQVTLMNPVAQTLTGWNEEDAMGKPLEEVFNIINEETGKPAEGPVNKVIREGVVVGLANHTALIAKDGTKRPVDDSGAPIRDDRGNITGVILVFRDITERKRAEEALRESEEKLRWMFKSATDGIIVADMNGVVLEINERAVEMYGFGSEGETLGKSVIEFVAHRDRQRAMMDTQRVLEQGAIRSIEYVFIKPDGSEFPGELSAGVMRNTSGNPVGFVGITRDITERKQAEEMLRESEEKYHAVFTEARDGIVLVDSDNFNIIDCNPEFENQTGRKLKQLTKMRIWEIRPPNRVAAAKKKFLEIKETGMGGSSELDFQKPDGEIVPIEFLAKRIKIRGKDYLQAITRDITERKQAEEKIRESLEEKELLLKEVHHRVKNNMQIISSLLKLQAGRIDDEKIRNLFNDSQNRIKSMSLVYNKLYQSADLASVNLKDYISELTNGLIQSYRGASGKILARVEGDNILLGVDLAIPCGLFINELISNSLKYAFPNNKNGEISVSLHETDKNEVEIIISDNGVGIPGSVDPKTTDTLGLYLVTTLVENQLAGKIELDRSRGTRFRITFNKNQ